MEEFWDARFKQRAVIEFFTAEKVSPIEIHRRMEAIYGDECVDVSTVRRWVRRFKGGELRHADLSDKTRSDCKWSRLRWRTDPRKINYAALKIIDEDIFLLFHYFIKISFFFPFILYLSGDKTYRPCLVLYIFMLKWSFMIHTLRTYRVCVCVCVSAFGFAKAVTYKNLN